MVPAMQFPSCENVSSGSTHILLVMTLGREGGGGRAAIEFLDPASKAKFVNPAYHNDP